jgi:class 3 adenylate cyclase/DNA-binding winged helix-turn-helix (wHTH) protein/tetratricopeptide (TPR) repeat protein
MQYIFGVYTLDVQRDELRTAAEVVQLDRQVFAVLVYLVLHHDRVVPRQELFEQLWPERFVSEAALERCIAVARRAVGDSGRRQHTIQTVHGRGYRFIAPVEARHAEVRAMEGLEAPAPPDRVEAGGSPGPVQSEPPSVPPPEQSTPRGARPPEPGLPKAERRQLTVLVCQLVGLPERAAPLDPETLLDVVPNFHRRCVEVIRRYTGHLAQDHGDGLVVYFGYPQAHEDDACRAVSAGLEIVEAMRRGHEDRGHAQGVQLAVRVGIHTGLVVMHTLDHGNSRAPLALGSTLAMATQLHGLAPPDTVVISPATLRLVEGYVVTQALGTYRLAAVSEPLLVSQVLQAQVVASRFAVTAIKGLTPLVGREQEVGLLCERWAQAREGLGQVVVLGGEAGIGKSRLVQAFTEHLAGDVYTRLECHCSPYAQQSALYPVIEQLQHRLQWPQEATPQDKLCALEAALTSSGLPLEEVVPLLAALLTLPLPAHYPSLPLAPQRQKQKTLEAIVAWWLKEAERQPVCLVVEDLHWVDPSSLELLSLLLDQVPTAPILVLLLSRPEFHPPWPPRSYLLHLALNRLSRPQVETMVAHLTGGKALPAEVHRQLVATTDGVPLFVEELTRMVFDTGLVKEREGHYALMGPLPPVAIPATLHDSLMARLDRLGAGKRVAQLGAVMGRQFTYGLLRAVAPWDEAALQRALGQLVDAELLYQRGYPPDATYRFKHALIQETAYQSLLKRTRQQYHQHVAQALAERFPETAETQPELLAHHYTEAGLGEQAIPWWHRAGQRAYERSAYVEAMTHITKGRELLPTVQDTRARFRHDLELSITLGWAVRHHKGQGSQEVEQTYTRALELCQQVGETSHLFLILSGLRSLYVTRKAFQKAREIAEQLLSVAQHMQDPNYLPEAYFGLGIILYYVGVASASLNHLQQGMALLEHRYPRSVSYGRQCHSVAARSLWELGYPDRALAHVREALIITQELPHTITVAVVLAYAARVHQCRREGWVAQERAEAALALAMELDAPQWVAIATMLRGEILA